MGQIDTRQKDTVFFRFDLGKVAQLKERLRYAEAVGHPHAGECREPF
jgi:hypothetical protein